MVEIPLETSLLNNNLEHEHGIIVRHVSICAIHCVLFIEIQKVNGTICSHAIVLYNVILIAVKCI